MKDAKLVTSLIIPIAILVVVLAVASSAAYASSGNVGLAAWNKSTNDFTSATYNISVRAGTSDVLKVDANSSYANKPGVLILDLTNVAFSGGQFDIYLSTDGYSSLSSGDKVVVSGLSVSDLNSPNKSITVSSDLYPNGKVTVEIGTVSGHKIVQLPAPFYVPGALYYFKIFDGSTTSVAVTTAKLQILPSVTISPTSGSTGTSVAVEGAAWIPSGQGGIVNVTVWSGTSIRYTKQLSPDANGQFKMTFTAPDEGKLAIPPNAGPAVVYPLKVEAWNGTTAASSSDYDYSVNFQETGRAFKYIETKNPDGSALANTGIGSFGSGTQTLNAKVGGEVFVNGTNFNVAGSIKVYWDYDKSTSFQVTPKDVFLNTTSGYFYAKFLVPETVKGAHLVAITDGSWSWNFTLNVQTSLVIEPGSAAPGATMTLKGYAFDYPAKVNVTFYGTKVDGNNETVLLAKNIATDSYGRFVVTAGLPEAAYGGNHTIRAYNDTAGTFVTTTMNIVPKIEVAKTKLAQGDKVTVNVWGWPVGTESISAPNLPNVTQGETSKPITVAWDNSITAVTDMTVSNNTGTASFDIVAVGTPGLHYVTVYDNTGALRAGPIAINVTGSTTEGSKIKSDLSALSKKVDELSLSVSTLSDSVSALKSDVAALKGDVAGVSSSLVTVKGTIAALRSAVDTLGSTVGTLKATVGSLGGTVSGLGGKVDAVSSKVDAVSTSVSGLTGKVSSLDSKVTSLSSDVASVKQSAALIGNLSNLVLATIVVAIIVLILEIVVLVRR